MCFFIFGWARPRVHQELPSSSGKSTLGRSRRHANGKPSLFIFLDRLEVKGVPFWKTQLLINMLLGCQLTHQDWKMTTSGWLNVVFSSVSALNIAWLSTSQADLISQPELSWELVAIFSASSHSQWAAGLSQRSAMLQGGAMNGAGGGGAKRVQTALYCL